MGKLKIAETVSTLTNPPIITIPLFVIICLTLSFGPNGFDLSEFIVLELVSLIFASILPMAIILYWAKKLGTDKDISNRGDRYTPLIVGIISYFIGFLICLIFHLDGFLTALLLCYSVNTGVVLLITTRWKISVHTTGLSGPIGALILLLGPVGSAFAVIYPIVIWSRVLLKKHTLAQAIAGGVQGFFLTVIEMYLFINLFNFNVVAMTGLLESILYVFAIIATPVVLGILGYINISNKRVMFILSQLALLAAFLIFTPMSVFAIFVLISLTSILISCYAGEDFVWFRILNSS